MLHVGPGRIRTWRCPRRWAAEPIAWEAWEAHLAWEAGQPLTVLTAPYPVPSVLLRAAREIRGAYAPAHAAYLERHRET